MAWTDEQEAAHVAILSTFGVPATFTPQGGSAIAITGVIRAPAEMEDVLPGSGSVVRLFVNLPDITPAPQRGDTITLNGNTYAVTEVDVDVFGGATLKLRIT